MLTVSATLTPKQILRAFSEARILVTMSAYEPSDPTPPNRSYWGAEFILVGPHGQFDWPNAPIMREPGETDQQLGLRVMHMYFQQLIALTPSVSVEIEWRTWPEIVISGHECRLYSRLAMRGI